MSWDAGTTAASANVPDVVRRRTDDPNTSSPGWKSVTFVPTASTTPATSVSRTGARGAGALIWSRRMYGTQ